LITGESGVGKDVAARVLHERSARAAAPFVTITCTAIPEALLESELFGHERGAFTDARARKLGLIEEARGGSVFLDEIGELPLSLQAKLLRFLEEQTFRRLGGTQDIHADVRIIAATHRDLHADVLAGSFRRDLYYRLSVLHVVIPPLRERRQDIAALASGFIERFNRKLCKQVRGMAPEALCLLEAQSWPGNARELRNVVERAMVLSREPVLSLDSLQLEHASTPPLAYALPPGGVDLGSVERDLVKQALARASGNQTRAAKLLGLSRDQIRYRIEKYQLQPE
jgi:transcriptional regulator with PAS, ATPase and Fis domain